VTAAPIPADRPPTPFEKGRVISFVSQNRPRRGHDDASTKPVAGAPPCGGGIFAKLKHWRRIWAVASIHGEADRLDKILDRIGGQLRPGDKVVFLGNYLGYGPDVAGALDRLIAFRRHFLARPETFLGDIVFLRGWQEEMWHKLLELQFSIDPRGIFRWMLDHGMAATLAAYSADPRQGEAVLREGVMSITRWTSALRSAVDAHPGHRTFLTTLTHAAATEDGKLLFVHAGYDPGKPLEMQGDVLWWGGADILAREEPVPGFERVVRGFDRSHGGLKRGPHGLSIDGGAGLGGKLMAVCFEQDGSLTESLSA
jgi:serine/threonine protein phosphatase 1